MHFLAYCSVSIWYVLCVNIITFDIPPLFLDIVTFRRLLLRIAFGPSEFGKCVGFLYMVPRITFALLVVQMRFLDCYDSYLAVHDTNGSQSLVEVLTHESFSVRMCFY
ncbi:hypothetical protein KP509_10G019500 [Ceratopteris richardii]|uniref:Uncharacterized protein n=1 Tax=Ceratopteris richardii TaxID=49495 RepID=A0A8T2TWP7_CERRI|nr:hypothetical protein KP509_10G019500 [Ceratopteris richardii]